MSKNWKFLEKVDITRIGDDSDNPQVYLRRWIILRTPWFGIMVHKFLLSDDDCLHDHPWPFWSFIFWGSYWEWCELDDLTLKEKLKFFKRYGSIIHSSNRRTFNKSLQIRRKFRAPMLLYRPATWKHRVEIQKPCWTLVVTRRNIRKWGFWTKEGWIHHSQYGSSMKCN